MSGHTRTVRTGGLSYGVTVQNPQASQVPLLLLNGVGASDAALQPIRDRLAGRPTMTIDAPPVPLPMWLHALNLAKVLSSLGYREIDVAGISYGGAVAQQLALTAQMRPALNLRINRMVLISTVTGVAPGTWRSLAGLSVLSLAPSLTQQLAQQTYGGLPTVSPAAVTLVDTGRASAFRVWCKTMGLLGWSSLPFLQLIRTETLVITGDDDQLVPLRNSQEIVRRMPNARILIIPGGGHLVIFEKIDAIAPLIAHHLDAAPVVVAGRGSHLSLAA
jgi:pimeloyl-ACP methyl ester carboxylesterase